MATIPYFVVGPTIILSLVGLLHGPDEEELTPIEDWRDMTVDVIIPAYEAEGQIDLCLASLARQTFKPRRIIVVDDASHDHTKLFAESFSKRVGIDVTVKRRNKNVGKTPSLKEGAYESDADIEFILDSDTILVSDNYIERTVKELSKGVGVASVCGVILPLLERTRSELLADPKVGKALQEHFKEHPEAGYFNKHSIFKRIGRLITNLYRDVLYKFLQKYVYHAEMVFFGTIVNPVGCAVAYRRKYIKAIFESSEEKLGDDLTTSEDIYIGFAFINLGYHNVQLQDIEARTLEPRISQLPAQMFLWSSAFLQSVYYFSALLTTPFKVFKKRSYRKTHAKKEEEPQSKRKVREGYREGFGEEITNRFGRPIGWFIFTFTVEKICFPIVLLIFFIFRLWEPLLITFCVELLISSLILTLVSKGQRIRMFFKSILVSPLRYLSILFDLLVVFWFLIEIWITKNRAWRK